MEFKTKERLIALAAVFLVVGAFAALIQADRSHGGFGSEIDARQVNTSVIKNAGHVTVPTLPADLLIFGADKEVKLDLSVENRDPDNDIDTVFVTVPDGTIMNGSVSWMVPSLIHEWHFTSVSSSEARFQAQDDLPGRVFGGSAQYDVSGNIDDALDYSLDPLVSEGITISLDFNTPSTQGVKSGAKGISLEVADLLTESPGSPRTLAEGFPHPFVVLDEDYEFLVYELSSDSSDLEVLYGTSMLFTGSRASDFQSSVYGFRYETGGKQVAVLDMPAAGTIVKPLIRANVNNGSDTFTISMWRYRTLTIDDSVPKAEWLTLVTSELSYTDQVPSTTGTPLDIDLDGDMIFNKNDNDRDGDGIPNNEDTAPDDPNIANRNPSVTRTYPDLTPITEGNPLVLHVDAVDPDDDQLTFTWSLDSDPAWTMTGRRIVVPDLLPGTYTFRVTVTDGIGGTASGSVTITVDKKDDVKKDNNWLIYLIIAVVVVLILLAVIFFVLRDKDTDEEPQELSPEHPLGGAMEDDEDVVGGAAPPSMEMDEDEDELDDDEDLDEDVKERPAAPVAPSKPATPESDSQEVQDLEQLIDDMEKTEEEIGDACPECSSPLGPYDTECPKCGAQFEIALECPNCGAVVEEASGKCPSCGVAFQ